MLQHFKTALLLLIYLPSVGVSYIIVWLDRKFRFPLSFPRDISELSQREQWCISELKKSGILPSNISPIEFSVSPINQDTIFRSNAGVITVKFELHGQIKSLRCFAKFAPISGTVWNRTVFNIQLNHIKEIFFNRYFVMESSGIPAPNVYYAQMNFITGNLCLITELMTDSVEYTEGVYENFPDWHLALTLEGMANLHVVGWQNKSKRMEKVLPIENSTVHLYDLIVAFGWSSAARKILVKSWCLMNQQQTILHGDARIGNMMFPKSQHEGRFVFIDWQAARKGMAVFDLAYFLVLSLTENHRMEVEQSAIKAYHEHLVAKGVSNYSIAQLEEDYRHACLCVLVLLSLPMLSGEASVEGKGAEIFAYGMNIWRMRMQAKFAEFDYTWLAKQYGITDQEGKNAIKEMLDVIDKRLQHVAPHLAI